MIWSVRQEYYNLQGDAWNDRLLLRADRVLLTKNRMTWRRGSIFRVDLPLAVSGNGQSLKAGLGDIYVQDILIPYISRKFAFGAGSGFKLPTATDARLGTGKWVVAPMAAPVWLFRKKGFLVLKLQDSISFAGDSKRPDIHAFSAYPIFVWRFHHWWWTQVEAESVTNFKNSNHTGLWTGGALGRMLSRRKGVFVKPQIGWGPYRPFDFAIRVSVFSVK